MTAPDRPDTPAPRNEPRTFALAADTPPRRRRIFRSPTAIIGLGFLLSVFAACLLTLPFTTGTAEDGITLRYNDGVPAAGRLPPFWVRPIDPVHAQRLTDLVDLGEPG